VPALATITNPLTTSSQIGTVSGPDFCGSPGFRCGGVGVLTIGMGDAVAGGAPVPMTVGETTTIGSGVGGPVDLAGPAVR
jgi:hypothetical protein